MKIFLFVLGLVFGVSADIVKGQESYLLKYYETLVQEIVQAEKLYETFISTDLSDKDEREHALNDFVEAVNATIRPKYARFVIILTEHTEDPTNSLIAAAIVRYRFNLTEVDIFMKTAIDNFMRASILMANFMNLQDVPKAIVEQFVVDTKRMLVTAEEIVKTALQEYKNEGWKKYFLDDVLFVLAKAKTSGSPADKLMFQHMTKYYPFRSWLVLLHQSVIPVPKATCCEFEPCAHYSLEDNRDIYVVHAPKPVPQSTVDEGRVMLRKVRPNKFYHFTFNCDRRAREVYQEMSYACRKPGTKVRHAFTAALHYDPDKQNIRTQSSDSTLLSRTVVKRRALLCSELYQVMVFA